MFECDRIEVLAVTSHVIEHRDVRYFEADRDFLMMIECVEMSHMLSMSTSKRCEVKLEDESGSTLFHLEGWRKAGGIWVNHRILEGSLHSLLFHSQNLRYSPPFPGSPGFRFP